MPRFTAASVSLACLATSTRSCKRETSMRAIGRTRSNDTWRCQFPWRAPARPSPAHAPPPRGANPPPRAHLRSRTRSLPTTTSASAPHRCAPWSSNGRGKAARKSTVPRPAPCKFRNRAEVPDLRTLPDRMTWVFRRGAPLQSSKEPVPLEPGVVLWAGAGRVLQTACREPVRSCVRYRSAVPAAFQRPDSRCVRYIPSEMAVSTRRQSGELC